MRKCNTRSHSELGSQAFQRRWYFVLRHGRVGRCQAIILMKNLIIVTGGAGFVGSNLIEFFIKNTNFRVVSIDNYSSGSKKNHIKSKRVSYIKGDTHKIFDILKKFKKNINTIFHFGEFSRIYQSFKKFNECYKSNNLGTKSVFKFCLDNKIKLVYSATSASLGNKGDDKIFTLCFYKISELRAFRILKNGSTLSMK